MILSLSDAGLRLFQQLLKEKPLLKMILAKVKLKLIIPPFPE
jgi:hypothetical protein